MTARNRPKSKPSFGDLHLHPEQRVQRPLTAKPALADWPACYEFKCCRFKLQVPFQAVTRHHGDYSVMGTPSLQPFLKTYWLTPVNDWPIVAKHANMTSSRGSINAAPATIRQNLFLHLAEPRLWLKMLQLTVKVRSFEGRPHGCSSAAFRWVWHFLR